MKLVYALLASGAEFTPDGRLWVLGGDIDVLYVQDTPAIQPVLTLVAKLLVPPTECETEHRLRIELTDPDNVRIRPDAELMFAPHIQPEYPDHAVGIGLSFVFQHLQFEQPGDHIFQIFVDDVELGTLPLTIMQTVLPASELEVNPL